MQAGHHDTMIVLNSLDPDLSPANEWMFNNGNLIISVLVVAVLYRRAKVQASSHCDQFSDILSTSSRSSSSSTISSSRSELTVPDKIDTISFHSEGQLRKSVSTTEFYTLKAVQEPRLAVLAK